MRILLQLLREFWLPLLLGIAWTIYNFVDRPLSQWTVREVINVAGPMFFIMSWWLAQWFRVKKQQRVEDGLTEIHAGVRAIQAPLLPCGLFITLELAAEDDDVERAFGQQAGFRAHGPDRPMPPPPVGLPPGMRDRLLTPGGYLEYLDGVVVAAGMFRHTHPGFNVIEREVRHTVCTLKPETLSKALTSRNDPLFATPFVRVEFFFKGKPSSNDAEPSLVLQNGMPSSVEVVGACALDNQVFVDFVVRSLSAAPAVGSSWSSSDLKGAFIRVTLDFLYIEGFSHLSRRSWPTLHNLQLWCGGKASQVFAFSIEQLRTQITRENPKPIAKGPGRLPTDRI